MDAAKGVVDLRYNPWGCVEQVGTHSPEEERVSQEAVHHHKYAAECCRRDLGHGKHSLD